MTGYLSPIPTIVALDYTSRVAGQPQERRMHVFTGPDGREVRCNPAACRECYREANWPAGQTKGRDIDRSAITLRCDKCKREQDYPRAADPSVPAAVAVIVVSRCDRCDDGDFGTEWWLDAAGNEVAP